MTVAALKKHHESRNKLYSSCKLQKSNKQIVFFMFLSNFVIFFGRCCSVEVSASRLENATADVCLRFLFIHDGGHEKCKHGAFKC